MTVETCLQSRAEMIEVAREIARNGEKLVQFVKVIARYCVDRRYDTTLLTPLFVHNELVHNICQ